MFRLNLTFLHIYFSSFDINKCNFGKLLVLDCDVQTGPRVSFVTYPIYGKKPKRIQVESFHLQMYYQHTYCGFQPKTSVFPSCPNVAIVTYLQRYVLHNTKLSFSVLDSNQLMSFPTPFEIEKYTQGDAVQKHIIGKQYFVQKEIGMQVYLFIVSKLNVIHFDAAVDAQWLFLDGPGANCKPLTPHKHPTDSTALYISSTFQCLAFLFNATSNAILMFNAQQNLNIEAARNITVQNDMRTTILHETSMPHHIIDFYFVKQKNQNTQLNISVERATHTGEDNTVYCAHAGLGVFDKKTDIFTICPKPTHPAEDKFESKEMFPIIYSTTDSLLLVLYQYRQYSSVSFVLKISGTVCKPMHINACYGKSEKESPIGPTFMAGDLDSTQLYDEVIKEYEDFSDLMAVGDCVILQFDYGFKGEGSVDYNGGVFPSKSIEKCFLAMKSEPMEKSQLTVKVTGFFRSKFSDLFTTDK